MSLLLYTAELVLESLLLCIPYAVLHFISGNIIRSTSRCFITFVFFILSKYVVLCYVMLCYVILTLKG